MHLDAPYASKPTAQQPYDVVLTSMRRNYVASKSTQRHFDVNKEKVVSKIG